MTSKRAMAMLVPLLAALVLGLLTPDPARALGLRFRTQGDSDTLSVVFDGGSLPEYTLKRVAPDLLRLTFPGAGQGALQPPGFAGARLVSGVTRTADGLDISLKNSAFGYMGLPVPDQPELRIQVFRDPTGAKWRDPAVRPTAAPAQPAAVPSPRPAPAPRQAAPSPAPRPVAAAAPVAPTQPVAPSQPAPPPAVETGPDTARQAFFNVPYAVRAEVAPSTAPLTVRPSRPGDLDPATGEQRYKAVTVGPEDMAAAVPVPAPSPPASATPPGQAPAQASASTPASTPPATPAVLPSSLQGPAPEPPPLKPQAPSEAAPAPQPAAAPAAGLPSSLQGPAPEPPPLKPRAPSETPSAAPSAAPAAPESAAPAAEPNATAPTAGAAAASNATAGPSEAEKHIQGLELTLLRAQSQISTGNLAEAGNALDDLLKDPLLTEKLREEALYSRAAVLLALHKDDMAQHFDEVSSAFQQAMNANTDSPSVPQALFSLGLVNLKVGNLPEARAYFGLLRKKYPNDENVPSIGFHWGEHWYDQGDYQKAADAFQKFIETYPENERLVRRASFLLAESLEKLGLNDQAFQIVDYIDKRWPQIYEEQPDFLRLAGNIEYRLGKYPRAKDHFWTFYNMNPKDPSADVVLARLGDIYLKLGDQRAAKEIYQRTIRDFPDKEGGLVAKMRLAEEGIYDEPTMVDMVSVFDRPYSKRPFEVYNEIADKHPESPLAPLALLKLGMWHYFHKEYPEALAAVRRLLDKYPRSDLVDRAKELADSTFALAVPELIARKQFPTVVDYWEKYGFARDSKGIDNATKIGVAESYVRTEGYDKGLELLAPFLTEQQVPQYSEMALAPALDAYLAEHAWNRIDALSKLATDHWQLSDRARRLIMHAKAVALENLGQDAKAVPLWAKLGADDHVEPFIRADALYYMAKAAMNYQDLKRVFVYAQGALSLLLDNGGDVEKIKDCMLMTIYATERSGRYQEALKWALEYAKYVPPDDPEWGSTRYKLAQIYRKAGAEKQWADTLKEIQTKEPDSLYGRLAASALETNRIEEQARQYSSGIN